MFESSLIDLETKNQPRGRRWLSLPIAVALHLVGIATFALASYWTVGTIQPADQNLVFLSLTPPPAPEGGGGGRPKPPKSVEKIKEQDAPTTKPPQTVQPTAETMPHDVPLPATPPQVEDVFTDAPSDDGSTGNDLPPGPGFGHGEGPGVGPGTGGGDGDGDDLGTGGGIPDDQPLHFTVGMTRPEVIHQVQPRYTEVARRAGVQGTVIVEAIIDEQGNVDNVRILRGLPMGLDKAAIEAIRQWRFKPATMGSKPVKVFFTLTVNFTIQR
jgi:periplasmic protein TonB